MGQNACQEGNLLLEEVSTPQSSVFCLSLATIPHPQIYICTFPSLFTLLFLTGPMFFCESRSCSVGRGLSSTSGKRRKSEFSNISQEGLQLQLPVPASDYWGLDMQPRACVSHPTIHLRGISSLLYFGRGTNTCSR